MNKDFDFIELIESNGLCEIKVNGTKIKNIYGYEIKRDTDIVELTIKISVPKQNLKTNLNP